METDQLIRARDGQSTSAAALRYSMANIFDQTEQVTGKLKKTIDKFTEGLGNVRSLDAEVAHFLLSVVSRTQHGIERTIERRKEDVEKATNEIAVADAKVRATQNEINQLHKSIEQSRHQEDRHKVARNVLIGASVLGGLGAVGSLGLLIFCFPAGAGAVGALVAGLYGSAGSTGVAAVIANNHDNDAILQRERRAKSKGDLTSQQTQLTALKRQKTHAEEILQNYTNQLKSIPNISAQLKDVQCRFQSIRNDLLKRRTKFTNAHITLEGSRSELEMCQFSRTRQQFVEGLNASLNALVGRSYTGRHGVTISQLREGILGINSRTSQLWNSLDLEAQQDP